LGEGQLKIENVRVQNATKKKYSKTRCIVYTPGQLATRAKEQVPNTNKKTELAGRII
jgi:hypothetical protein